MNYKYLLRAISLLALMISFLPASSVDALLTPAQSLEGMFQLPWDQGLSWVAIDGLDNGTKRPLSSSHHFTVGGAIDFAPHNNMVRGEDTSNFWVTAAATGTVVETSNCHVKIAHGNGWLTEYQFLAKIQVKLGDPVSQNQRLGILADGLRQKFCPGSAEPNVPHLHFILRPTLIGASLGGWVINYLPVLNKTTFTKNGQTLGLFKPLSNVFDSTPTPTATAPGSETPSATLSPTLTSSVLTLSKTANPQTYGQVGQLISYNFTITNTGAAPLGPAQFVINDDKLGASLSCGPATVVLATNQTLTCTFNYTITQADMSAATLTNIATASGAGQTSAPVSVTITNLVMPATPTPTLFGQYVSTTVNPQTINLGETTEVTVSLNNVPAEGYTSAEFTCFYEPSVVEVSNITATDLFGNDAVIAINESQFNRFIVAIAGSSGNKANTSGAAFTFNVKGLQIVQTQVGCEARVSKGDNELTQLPSARTHINIIGDATSTPTPNLTPPTPTVLPSTCDKAEFIADINVPPGTVMSPGTTFVKTWRLKNVGSCTWSRSYQLVFFYGEQMGAFSSAALPVNVSIGQTVDISINMTAPNAPGSYRGYWMFMNTNGAFFGIGPDANQPWFVDINVSGPTLPPSLTPTFVPSSPTTTTPDGPTATQTPISGFPTTPPADCNKAEFVADINLPPGTTVLPGESLGKGWRVKNVGSCTWTPSYGWTFVSGDLMNAGIFNTFAYNVLPGQEVEIFTSFLAPTIPGHYQSFWKLRDASGVLFGVGDTASDPLLLDVVVSGPTVTPVFDLTPTPSPLPTSTLPPDWLTFMNLVYGFEFKYPPQGVIADGRTDGFARIDLPFVAGTNLREKYVEVIVQEDASTCQSPLPSQFSETITINGISFLKQSGGDGGAGHIHQWIAYSALRDNICVSLDFILHSLNPGNFPTPPPSFDFGVEAPVFEQIVSTYRWLSSSPTATPIVSPTGTQASGAVLTGQVIAARVVTVRLFDLDENFVAIVNANPDGTFRFDVATGTYTIIATANGFLRAQGQITLSDGEEQVMPVLALLAGDIDDNNEIDQFDAMTIGMNYNATFPEAADLNNDGIINVLDLELLAKNYRKTGPVVWE